MKKKKRVPLSVKVNLVIMALVLSVSVLLTMISENTYQKAVFRPYFRKLESTEIPADDLKPILREFLSFFGSEELEKARVSDESENNQTALWNWVDAKPSQVNDSPATVLDDWILCKMLITDIQMAGDLHEVSCVAEKDGKQYDVCSSRDNESIYSAKFQDFGNPLPEGGPAAADCLSPTYVRTEGNTWLVRSIPIDLEDGGRAWIWLTYDLTEETREHGYFLLRCVLLTLGVTLLASVITALVMRRYVLKPVRSLARATRGFVPEEDGTYSPERISRADIRNNDEIGDLSRDIRTMQESIVTNTGNLARLTAERERAATELELAARIQADALPNVFPAFPDHGEFDIYASMTPAKEVGGDFYDFFLIDETHLGIVMADVSDKGVPAALFMMSAKTLIRMNAKTEISPAQVMQAVNDRLRENNRELMFVTVWFGILDLETGRITAVNAGHEDPALMPAGMRFNLIRDEHGFMVGARKRVSFRETEMDLAPGAKLFLYTDGVPEAQNAAGEMFGEARMIRALNEGREKTPEELLRHMKQAVGAFVQDAAQFDDLTMLCLEYKGPDTVPQAGQPGEGRVYE